MENNDSAAILNTAAKTSKDYNKRHQQLFFNQQKTVIDNWDKIIKNVKEFLSFLYDLLKLILETIKFILKILFQFIQAIFPALLESLVKLLDIIVKFIVGIAPLLRDALWYGLFILLICIIIFDLATLSGINHSLVRRVSSENTDYFTELTLLKFFGLFKSQNNRNTNTNVYQNNGISDNDIDNKNRYNVEQKNGQMFGEFTFNFGSYFKGFFTDIKKQIYGSDAISNQISMERKRFMEGRPNNITELDSSILYGKDSGIASNQCISIYKPNDITWTMNHEEINKEYNKLAPEIKKILKTSCKYNHDAKKSIILPYKLVNGEYYSISCNDAYYKDENKLKANILEDSVDGSYCSYKQIDKQGPAEITKRVIGNKKNDFV